MKTLISIALAATATLVAVPAHAGDKASREVHFGDLDLSKSAGQKALHARVWRATKQVCEAPAAPVLEHINRFNNCRRTAFENALPQLHLAMSSGKGQSLAMVAGTR